MPPLNSKEEMDAKDSGDVSDDEPMSTDMLEDIRDGSKSHPRVNRRETCYKIRDRIKRIQTEWKRALLSTQNMGKILHKVFRAVVNEIPQVLPILVESGSEVSYFIPDTIKFSEVTRFSYDIKKPWLKATLEEIKNIINNRNFIVQEPEKGEPVTPFMDVYKDKTQSDGSLDNLKLIILFRGDLQNKELVGGTWSSTALHYACSVVAIRRY